MLVKLGSSSPNRDENQKMLEVSPPRPPFGQVVHQRDPIPTFQIEDANAFGSETKMTISDALEVILGGSRVGREDPSGRDEMSLEVYTLLRNYSNIYPTKREKEQSSTQNGLLRGYVIVSRRVVVT